MAKIITMFNHKGGVSKTTTVFNLGWTLARMGKRVVMVDADPQCNLTGVVLGLNPVWPSNYAEEESASPSEYEADAKEADEAFARSQERSERVWMDIENKSLFEALRPAFEAEPRLMEPADCIPVEGRDGLFLLPGSLRLGEFDVTLSIASELSSSCKRA